LISKFAPIDSTVLISGESGTGKELAAKAIHQNSPRKSLPFIAINCAVLSKELLESELFGYEKGAFTGAIAQKKGKFELAEGGTIFLDEIGELDPNIQAKLLRFLQEREFERVGGIKTLKADVRIIAATNRMLKEDVEKGLFRQDLYFRLNVLQITMPSLRERKSDIPLLADYFVNKYANKCGRDVSGISDKVRQLLSQYDWYGNVRELENTIERAVVLSVSDMILPEDLPDELIESMTPELSEADDFHSQVKAAKQQIIIRAIENASGNYSDAAEKLRIHPNNLHRIIRNLEIKNEINEIVK
jgi:Nif-specific regulatory protein